MKFRVQAGDESLPVSAEAATADLRPRPKHITCQDLRDIAMLTGSRSWSHDSKILPSYKSIRRPRIIDLKCLEILAQLASADAVPARASLDPTVLVAFESFKVA